VSNLGYVTKEPTGRILLVVDGRCETSSTFLCGPKCDDGQDEQGARNGR